MTAERTDREPSPKRLEYHTHCGDCGRFIPKERWVRKDHPTKRHALCWDCYCLYDDPAFM